MTEPFFIERHYQLAFEFDQDRLCYVCPLCGGQCIDTLPETHEITIKPTDTRIMVPLTPSCRDVQMWLVIPRTGFDAPYIMVRQ